MNDIKWLDGLAVEVADKMSFPESIRLKRITTRYAAMEEALRKIENCNELGMCAGCKEIARRALATDAEGKEGA